MKCWRDCSHFALSQRPSPSLVVPLIFLGFYYRDNSRVSKQLLLACLSQPRLKKSCVYICVVTRKSVRMTVLLADERRCAESAEEDRSPQSGGGAYRQAMKQKKNPDTDKSLAASTTQMKRNLVTKFSFEMRVMQMTQRCLTNKGFV